MLIFLKRSFSCAKFRLVSAIPLRSSWISPSALSKTETVVSVVEAPSACSSWRRDESSSLTRFNFSILLSLSFTVLSSWEYVVSRYRNLLTKASTSVILVAVFIALNASSIAYELRISFSIFLRMKVFQSLFIINFCLHFNSEESLFSLAAVSAISWFLRWRSIRLLTDASLLVIHLFSSKIRS